VTSDGDRREATEWFNVVAFNNLAEICNQFLRKGSRVYIEGHLQSRTWEDDNGCRHYRAEVVANEMLVLDSRNHSRQESSYVDDDEGPDLPF
jgi:single-strand DNA-binding protein